VPTRHGPSASKNFINWPAAELLSDNDNLSRVDAVNLECVRGYIQTDRGNLQVDGYLV
jgi:hypothetical protein